MIVHPTRILADKLSVSVGPDEPCDPLMAWRAHYVQGHRQRFVVFLNEATQFVIVINGARVAALRKLAALFQETLRATLRRFDVDPTIIDHYLADLGSFTYAKRTDRTITAQLNHAISELWWAIAHGEDNVELSRWANSRLVDVARPGGCYEPNEAMINALARYGTPVQRIRAFDLTVRLDLDGLDAVRRLRVPASMAFEQLHRVLQAAFGWTDAHLHSFELFHEWGGYGAWPSVELVMDVEDEDWERPGDVKVLPVDGVSLSDFIPEYTKVLYTYDFGDSWRHYIEVDAVIDDCRDALPVLLSGHRDAPPEDVGGIGGWGEFLAIMADPDNAERTEMAEWAASQSWQPFDRERTAARIASMAPRRHTTAPPTAV